VNKRGLGRGLQALLPDIGKEEKIKEKVVEIPLSDIRINKNQPRQTFNEEKLRELALSIQEHGVIQPIIVRTAEDGKYEIVAGERRWRACRLIGAEKIPVIIKNLSEKETKEIALIENIQREDLNPIEEAEAYRTLMEEYGLTQEELSKRVGKSRPFIANTVRLLGLPEMVRKMVSEGLVSAGHARALLSLPSSKLQEEIAQKIVAKGLSVRQAEKTVKELLSERKKTKKPIKREDPILQELEERLITKLSTKVRIKHGNKSGKIEIEYYGEDELQRILEALLGETEL